MTLQTILDNFSEHDLSDWCWDNGRELFRYWMHALADFCQRAGLDTVEKVRERMLSHKDILIIISEVA